jgi:hypothetical protein
MHQRGRLTVVSDEQVCVSHEDPMRDPDGTLCAGVRESDVSVVGFKVGDCVEWTAAGESAHLKTLTHVPC